MSGALGALARTTEMSREVVASQLQSRKQLYCLTAVCHAPIADVAHSPIHPPPTGNLLTLIVVRAEGEWHLWTRNWIRAWQFPFPIRQLDWVALGYAEAGMLGNWDTGMARMCQVALPADFNILSHYVDNLDVCLAHSRRIQFGANAARRQPTGEICKVNSKPVRDA